MRKESNRQSGIELTDDGVIFCDSGIEIYYKIPSVKFNPPTQAVLMDLDGTSVQSEDFWIYLIEKTVKELKKDNKFSLSQSDLPYVSGFTTYQHLSYCKEKYGFSQSLAEADALYHNIAESELLSISQGKGNTGAFKPRSGIKDFIYTLKQKGILIGLATSGLEYKAVPEILSLCRAAGLGEPFDVYDAIVTGGKRKKQGYGTLGEIAAKPHPFIYSELAKSLGLDNSQRVIVLEDSFSGVLSARTAGYNVIGFSDGNIKASGGDGLCLKTVSDFEEILKIIT